MAPTNIQVRLVIVGQSVYPSPDSYLDAVLILKRVKSRFTIVHLLRLSILEKSMYGLPKQSSLSVLVFLILELDLFSIYAIEAAAMNWLEVPFCFC